MNSPKLKRHTEFDASIGHELKSWGARQHAPGTIRTRILEQAAAQPGKKIVFSQARKPRFVAQFQRWLSTSDTRRKPQIPYTELSQWLFNQAMWQSLGNDRRSVRFVC